MSTRNTYFGGRNTLLRIVDDPEREDEVEKLAVAFRAGANERDRERTFPHEPIEQLRRTALPGLLIPSELGGLGASFEDYVEVLMKLAWGDPCIAQIYHVHAVGTPLIELLPLPLREQVRDGILGGRIFLTNAWSEVRGVSPMSFATKLSAEVDGYTLSGEKFYCTGSLAGTHVYGAAVDASGSDHTYLYVTPLDVDGIEVRDDWNGMGQRTTASGTIVFHGVRLPGEAVIDMDEAITEENLTSVLFQIGFAAIYVGIARDALADTVGFLNDKARPWFQSGVERAVDDPYVRLRVGELATLIDAAAALLREAARRADAAAAEPSVDNRGEASVATSKAKIICTKAALDTAMGLFQLCGSGSVLSKYGFDRHLRNARTLTLHDPVDYKQRLVGDHVLLGRLPEVTSYT